MILKCGSHELSYESRTLIMGILNATPDSFSDGGKFNEVKRAVTLAKQMVLDGAHIIDIGGESTRPDAIPVSLDEELSRVIPIIKAVSAEVNIPISIDTYKSEVAKEAIAAGATMINDIWGAKADPKMANVAADYNVPINLMHNREEAVYEDLIRDVVEELFQSIELIEMAGVPPENVFIDPGIGFAKNFDHNIEIIRNMDTFSQLGYPLVIGASRKSFIGKILDLPVYDRVEGTAAIVAASIINGAHIVRVHDVLEMARIAKVLDFLYKGGMTY